MPFTLWQRWERMLSRSARKTQELHAVSTGAVRIGYFLIVDDELDIGPQIRQYEDFASLSDAYKELPETCYAVPFYGSVIQAYKSSQATGKQRFLLHPSGKHIRVSGPPLTVVPDFYVGDGPIDLLAVDAELSRALPSYGDDDEDEGTENYEFTDDWDFADPEEDDEEVVASEEPDEPESPGDSPVSFQASDETPGLDDVAAAG